MLSQEVTIFTSDYKSNAIKNNLVGKMNFPYFFRTMMTIYNIRLNSSEAHGRIIFK
jgi:hypothetical protein